MLMLELCNYALCWLVLASVVLLLGFVWPRLFCCWFALASPAMPLDSFGCSDAGAMLERCWNHAGTMLESCWNDADTMLAPCWNAAARMLARSCNDAGTMLGRLERCWDDADAGMMQERCCSCHLKIVFASTDSHVCSLAGKTLLSVGGAATCGQARPCTPSEEVMAIPTLRRSKVAASGAPSGWTYCGPSVQRRQRLSPALLHMVQRELHARSQPSQQPRVGKPHRLHGGNCGKPA